MKFRRQEENIIGRDLSQDNYDSDNLLNVKIKGNIISGEKKKSKTAETK